MKDKTGKLKKLIAVLFALLLCAQVSSPVFAITSYTYNKNGEGGISVFPAPAPAPYRYSDSIYASDLGVASLSKLTALYVGSEFVYITNGNTLIIADYELKPVNVISSVGIDGEEEALTDLNGIFATDDGETYVCEPAKGRILHFNPDYTLKRIIGKPQGITISESVQYQPLKVVVDSHERIYCIANNVYEGIIEMNQDGTFSRYFGVVKVKYTAADLFWRSIQTEIQRSLSSLWLPVNFSNMSIDNTDFIYATVAEANSEFPLRKLNSKGNNIIRYPLPKIVPRGDWWENTYGVTIPTGPSILTIVDVTDFGVYIAFDKTRSHVFGYDDDGYLLFAFGDSGSAEGRFTNITDMKIFGDKLLFADKGASTIEVYELTEYGKSIYKASELQFNSDYIEAAEEWKNVLSINPHFQYAYVGVGKALYRNGDYEESLQYFLEGQDTEYYSMAYQKVRQNFVSNNFTYAALIIAAVAAAFVALKTLKKHSLKRREAGREVKRGVKSEVG